MRQFKVIALVITTTVAVAACLTAGHFGAFGGSEMIAHILLWGGFAVIVLSYQRRAKVVRVLGILSVMSALGSWAMFVVAEEKLILQSVQRGDSIVSALERFNVRHGAYPQRLDELLPEYLNEVPSTRMRGVRYPLFWYEEGLDDYQLGFRTTSDLYCSRSRSSDWNCGLVQS